MFWKYYGVSLGFFLKQARCNRVKSIERQQKPRVKPRVHITNLKVHLE